MPPLALPLALFTSITEAEAWIKLACALVTLATTTGLLAWFRYWIGKFTHRAEERLLDAATTAGIQAAIRQQLEDRAAAEDPAKWFTLLIRFSGCHQMRVPLFRSGPAYYAQNISMRVIDHTAEETVMELSCPGFGHLPPHDHGDYCETVEVRRGTVTHIESGRIYRKGDTWAIPPGQTHSAAFQDAFCLVTHRPALPTGLIAPLDLAAMPAVFPRPS